MKPLRFYFLYNKTLIRIYLILCFILQIVTPLGNVPLLTVNGKVIPQSRAIERYLAREFGKIQYKS
jgi:hypothetical protein